MSTKLTNNIARLCQNAAVPISVGWTEPLSTYTALLIASGYLDPNTRSIIIRRAKRFQKNVPRIASEQLRHYAHERRYLLERKKKKKNLPFEQIINLRLMLVNRKIAKIKHQIYDVIGHNDNFLTVRRSRKEGIHLSTERSAELFEAMLKTPTPNLIPGTIIGRIAQAARNSNTGAFHALQIPGALNNKFELETEYRFADPYETLLYISGQLYQRIVASPAEKSDYFTLQFQQINIHHELAQIATDTTTLRTIREELDSLEKRELPAFIARKKELSYVWEQLCTRVEALARIASVLDDVEKKLHELNQMEQSTLLHTKIDELIARQSANSVSIGSHDMIAQQLEDNRKQLEFYRLAISGDISELLEGRKNTKN